MNEQLSHYSPERSRIRRAFEGLADPVRKALGKDSGAAKIAREALERARIAELRENLTDPEFRRNMAERIGALTASDEKIIEAILRSRYSRLAHETKIHPIRYFAGKTVRSLLEMISIGLGPWGIGDLITLYEGVKGKEIVGRRLDLVDRYISFAAALIPFVPATPFREAVRVFRRHLEDSVAKRKGFIS